MQFSHFLKRKVCNFTFKMEKQSLKKIHFKRPGARGSIGKNVIVLIFIKKKKEKKRCSSLFNCSTLFSYKEEKMLPGWSKKLCKVEPVLPLVHGEVRKGGCPSESPAGLTKTIQSGAGSSGAQEEERCKQKGFPCCKGQWCTDRLWGFRVGLTHPEMLQQLRTTSILVLIPLCTAA